MGKVIKMPLQLFPSFPTAAATHDVVQNREILNTSHRNGSSPAKQHCMHVVEYYVHLIGVLHTYDEISTAVELAWHERKKAEGLICH